MNALPNADNRRGGKNPSSVGLTSDTSPEVQGLKTENSHTGGVLGLCAKRKEAMVCSACNLW